MKGSGKVNIMIMQMCDWSEEVDTETNRQTILCIVMLCLCCIFDIQIKKHSTIDNRTFLCVNIEFLCHVQESHNFSILGFMLSCS